MIELFRHPSQTGFIFAIAVAPGLIQITIMNLCRDRSKKYYEQD